METYHSHSIGLKLLAKLISLKTLKPLTEQKITPEMFLSSANNPDPPEREILRFVYDGLEKYGELPSQMAVEYKFNIKFGPCPDPIDYYIDELIKRYTGWVVQDGMEAASDRLRNQDTKGALAAMAAAVQKAAPNLTSHYIEGRCEVRLSEGSGPDLRQAGSTEGGANLVSLPLLGTDNFIVRGWSHLLAAYPKVGKTELIVRQCLSWELPILFITEEPQSIWQVRLAGMPDHYDFPRLRVVFGLGADANMLLDRIKTGEEQVIIIDTIRNLLGFQDEKDNTEIARVLTPFIAAAREKGKTLIFIHHIRKGGGEHGEGISGGHAFLGVVDMALELRRDLTGSNRRVIRGWGRIITVPEIMYELSEKGEFRVLGDPKGVELNEVMRRAKEILDLCDEKLKVDDIRERFNNPKPSPNQLRDALNLLAKEFEIERDPPISEGSKRGKTYRYGRIIDPAWPVSPAGNSKDKDLDELLN